MIFSVLLLCAGLVSGVSAACSRNLLEEATAAYLRAQIAGQPSILLFTNNVTYVENDAPMDIKSGVLSQPVVVDFNRSLYDTTDCVTYTEVVAATNSHPYVISTRLTLVGEKVTKIESVVSDDGDWIFDAAKWLSWTKQEKWDPIPEADQDSRAVIKAAGDAYLDNWGNFSVPVPYGTPCARLEGGIYTGDKNASANTCRMGEFPEKFTVTNRRYVIDEVVGGLGMFNDFPFLDKAKPKGTPSTNLFRVEKGMIRYINENTVCTERMCGR